VRPDVLRDSASIARVTRSPDPAKRKPPNRTDFNTAWRGLSRKLSENRSVLEWRTGGHFEVRQDRSVEPISSTRCVAPGLPRF